LMTYKGFKNYEQEKLIVFEFVNNSNVFYGLATSQEMLIRNIYMNIGELKEIINITLALYWMILDINNKIINLELTLDCLFTKYWLYTGYLVAVFFDILAITQHNTQNKIN
jgi:hypothetical protein